MNKIRISTKRQKLPKKEEELGAPGWLSQVSIQLLILAQVMIPGSWDQVPCQAPC